MQELDIEVHLIRCQSSTWDFRSKDQKLGLFKFEHSRSTEISFVQPNHHPVDRPENLILSIRSTDQKPRLKTLFFYQYNFQSVFCSSSL